jgi:hypothetical protein
MGVAFGRRHLPIPEHRACQVDGLVVCDHERANLPRQD